MLFPQFVHLQNSCAATDLRVNESSSQRQGAAESQSALALDHTTLLFSHISFCPLMLVSKHTGADTVSGPSSLGPPRSLEYQPETPKELILRVSSFPKIHTSHSNTFSLASSFYKLMSGRVVRSPMQAVLLCQPSCLQRLPQFCLLLFSRYNSIISNFLFLEYNRLPGTNTDLRHTQRRT